MTTVKQRVAKGVKWLDEHHKGWEKRVILQDFDIRSGCRCVLGQVYEADSGEYGDGYSYAVIFNKDISDNPEDYGFDYRVDMEIASNDPGNEWEKFDALCQKDYDALQAEWLRVIKKRQK